MNNRAVSPVVGVILVVAITLFLAAAIGSAFFLASGSVTAYGLVKQVLVFAGVLAVVSLAGQSILFATDYYGSDTPSDGDEAAETDQ